MGGLIMTRGTKRLVAHYNDEFDTWIDFYRSATIINKFNRSGSDIDVWAALIATIVDPAAPGNGHAAAANTPTLLPPPHPKHANLHKRWKYFLQNDLKQINRNKLADHIFTALCDPSIKYIVFDVVHGGFQDVMLNMDDDDGTPIARINLKVKDVMLKHPQTPGGHDPDDIDN
jgi:hypothetical protein